MDDINTLKQKFSADNPVAFRLLESGVILLKIDNPLCTATISLYGGQVIDWHPKNQPAPVLWRSDLAVFSPGKPIRAGVPICWPWFGPHPDKPGYPSHGYARTASWQLELVSTQADGSTALRLSMLNASEKTKTGNGLKEITDLPYQLSEVRLSLNILIGHTLSLELTTSNTGNHELELTEALHAYFKISDISTVSVTGLHGCEYIDSVNAGQRERQQGRITFTDRLDRVYVNTPAVCQIDDPGLNRMIKISKTGSSSTVVWNPWLATASKMEDLGAQGWRGMVCVESANALENRVKLPPQARHSLSVTYAVVNS